MDEFPFINPTFDLPFKKIFGSEHSSSILVSFLNAIIYDGEPIIIDALILNPYIPGEGIVERVSIVDIQVVLNNGDLIIVEMQKGKEAALKERFVYNGAKRLATQLEPGDLYTQLVPVISIIIVDFEMFAGQNEPISHFIFRDEKSGQSLFVNDILHFFVLELPKSKQASKNLKEDSPLIDKWLAFLNEADRLKEVPPVMAATPAINQAFEIAKRLNLRRTEREIMEQIERDRLMREETNRLIKQEAEETIQQAEETRQQAEEAIEQAAIRIDQTRREIATKLIAKGIMSLEEIAAIAELSLEDVQNLAKAE